MKKSFFLLLVLTIICGKESYAQTTTSGNMHGHDYVDLGLPSGRLWATCNLGAEKSIDYGDYFAWGETEAKKDFTWDNYKWGKDEGLYMTKYCVKEGEGKVDNKTKLDKEDDAATANWGKEWRMPTSKEQQELIDGCTWDWVANYEETGVAGRLGYSKANGNIIFLPAAGSISNTEKKSEHIEGFYWSSSLTKYTMNGSYFLCFGNYYIDYKGNKRFMGRSIRPVVSENMVVSKASRPATKKTTAKK